MFNIENENPISTPFSKMVNEEIELDETSTAKLEELAAQYNMTTEEVARHILMDAMSEVVDVYGAQALFNESVGKSGRYIVKNGDGEAVAAIQIF